MRRTTIQALGAGAVAALLLASCANGDSDSPGGDGNGSSGGDDVTLTFTWWGNDDRANRYQESIDLFEAEHPNITINPNFVDWDGYWTARNTEAAGRALPDVMQFDLSYLREYSQNGHLLDLSPYVGDQIDLSGFDDAVIANGVLNDEYVGIPTSVNTLATFINPGLLEETGVDPLPEGFTWEEYTDWILQVYESETMTEDGQRVYGSGDYTGTFWFFTQWLVQQGVQPFTDEGEFGFDESHATEFLNLTQPLRDAEAHFPNERGAQVDPLSGFTVGEVVGEQSWDNFLAGYVADSGVEDLEMMPMPSGPNGPEMFFKASMLLSAGANTEHPEEAALFINFLLTEPEVGTIFGTSKGVPADEAQREAMDLEEGGIDHRVTAFEEEHADLVTAETPIPVLGFGAIEAEWMRLAEDLGYGMITVDEFVEQWFAEAELAMQ